MKDMSTVPAAKQSLDYTRGAAAAKLVWNDDPAVEGIDDPRTPDFARGMIDSSSRMLKESAGLIKKMINRAAAAAEDLAVAKFQGLIEIIQNADDTKATEVRFALRKSASGRELLIVHNGEPITCNHVLPMALPFLTTKSDRTDQRGRFGIGLKTLKRIASTVSVHSEPYHFSGDQLHFDWVEPERRLSGFYDPKLDTMLVLGLNDGFDETELKAWFAEWQDDGLLFLASVSRFRWCDLRGKTIDQRHLEFGQWQVAVSDQLDHGPLVLRTRAVTGGEQNWTVWRATIGVPRHLHPAHKARSETTDISIAIPEAEAQSTVYIGFKTAIACSMPFSLDASFDPSTSREGMIENEWNNWLLDRCADVISHIAGALFSKEPARAWQVVPLLSEHIGSERDRWLRTKFDGALAAMRRTLAKSALVTIGSEGIPFPRIAYEADVLSDLLTPDDLLTMLPEAVPLPKNARGPGQRWRHVLNELNVSQLAGISELLGAFDDGLFSGKAVEWWVSAAACLIVHHRADELFGRPFLMTPERRALECEPRGDTKCPIVYDAKVSAFAEHWKLFNQLHLAYGEADAGQRVIAWLKENAAFTVKVSAAAELAAFAERYALDPRAVSDAELRELRDRFDMVSADDAEDLGSKVGAAVLIEAYFYRRGKPVYTKVLPTRGCLPRTLEGDQGNWPTAAAHTAGINWISPKYEAVLKTDVRGGAKRKRADGTMSRGPRKFLLLLGAETGPRIVKTEKVYGGDGARRQELKVRYAEQVEYDYVSPDLTMVLRDLSHGKKKDAKLRSPALLRALARNWHRLYADRLTVPAQHIARKYIYARGFVTAAWLNELRETAWVAVGRGQLELPAAAVIRTNDTETVYESFVCDIEIRDIHQDVARAFGFVTEVRVSDLLGQLEQYRDTTTSGSDDTIKAIYRSIAKRCPPATFYNTSIGEITAQELRERFALGRGLICVSSGEWRRPDEVRRGLNIFTDRHRFVPGGSALNPLWDALGVREPDVADCIHFCRELARSDPSGRAAALMDVYRYMEPLLKAIERRDRDKLRSLPLVCSGGWTTERPVFYVEDPEQREQLASLYPKINFWEPPCDPRDFPTLVPMLGIERLAPVLEITSQSEEALARGEAMRIRFSHAVDHLSSELARSDPKMRDQISISWDKLRSASLFAYENPFNVRASIPALSRVGISLLLRAHLTQEPLVFHIREEDMGDREHGGRMLASLFPRDIQRRIDAEWALAWLKSHDTAAIAIRLASDEKRREAMEEQAAKIANNPKVRIKVTAPAARKPTQKLRTLKQTVGGVVNVTVQSGSPPQQAQARNIGLRSSPPAPSSPTGERTSVAAYSAEDVEFRGWEILSQALQTSSDARLVDFRKRHGVGADGALDWKQFIEMKATARGPQTQVEFTNAEYQRAKERGSDFILALVSGLEEGQKDEVRLIFDPVNCAGVRPSNGVRLVNLLEAPAVIIHFGDSEADDELGVPES